MINQLADNQAAILPAAADPGKLWHVITCEYPPQLGGVSDYTRLVAEHLAKVGDEVHVWRPAAGASPTQSGVTVHDTLGNVRVWDLWRMGKRLNAFARPRHLLVQWVPHGYGFRSMNVAFCLWLWARAAWRGDIVEIMVHEPYLSFGEGSRRQNAVALIHRVMTIILLRSASKVFVSIPAWEACWRPYTLGRKVDFQWLPIPSSIGVCVEPGSAATLIRERYLRGYRFLLGHFGIHGSLTTRALEEIIPLLLDRCPKVAILLLGKGSEEFRDKLLARTPQYFERIHAGGVLAAEDLSRYLAACDLLLQPYPDGISTRRTSAMAALAHGVPMVTTSGRLTEDCWRECDAVVTVPAGNSVSFVNAVERLLDAGPERNRMGLRARALYEQRFDIKHVVGALRHNLSKRLTTEE